MQFHKQLSSHVPSLGKIGDCFRTVLACLLDLDPKEVPHFLSIHYTPDGIESDKMKSHINDWLATKNMTIIDIPYPAEEGSLSSPEILMKILAERDGEDLLYMMTGRSMTSNHVVICRGSKMLWDPSPMGNGLVAPIDGHYWVSYLLPLSMRYNP